MDLIDRSALIEELQELIQRNPHTDARSRSQHNSEITACIYRVNTQPSIDAVPAVNGEWIKTRLAGEYECSNCHSLEYERFTKSGIKLFDFCPNCGADMRKKVQDA